MPNDLCSVDITTPQDTTFENEFPGFLRDFKEQVVNSFLLEHVCDGKHFAGVDTDGGGAAMVVDVGGMSGLVGAPYAGLFVHVKPIVTNLAAPTLTVKSGGVTIAAGPVWFRGATIEAGLLTAGQWIEVVWDGTNWQVLSGISFLPSGSPVLLEEDDTTTITTPLDPEVNAFEYTTVANSYSKIIMQVEFYITNATGSKRSITPRFRANSGATLKGITGTLEIPANSVAFFSMSYAFTGMTAAANVLQFSVFSTDSLSISTFIQRIWGVK